MGPQRGVVTDSTKGPSQGRGGGGGGAGGVSGWEGRRERFQARPRRPGHTGTGFSLYVFATHPSALLADIGTLARPGATTFGCQRVLSGAPPSDAGKFAVPKLLLGLSFPELSGASRTGEKANPFLPVPVLAID